MAYTVLARKYRSWTFDELVGQEAVATTLKNAITSGRIAHGYLFCGTRGVGKTSAARIMARSLNCLTSPGPTVSPCCECESCTSISEGQDVDVIEIDAASNTGVDNIRELRSNTVFRPARSRFKVYIIDEVHMLSTGAFNALLKTLEEPPGHVKFILATTDPQKVPATILSRVQRFDFRTISVDKIAAHFDSILKKEGIEADAAVTRRVARLANGSMRDGLSLLDQLLAMGSGRLTLAMIEDVLPTPHDEQLMRLIGQWADRDAAGALASADAALAAGYTLERLTESLAEQVRILMLLHICGDQTELVDVGTAVRQEMAALAKRFEPEAFVYMIAVLEELRRNVRFSALGRSLLDATMVRLASAVSYRSIQSLLEELGGVGDAPAANGAPPAGRPAASPPPAGARSASPPASPRAASRPSAGSAEPAPRPTPAASAPAPVARRAAKPASQEDLRQARSEPVVREALDLFGGTLINVERVGQARADQPTGEADEDVSNGTDTEDKG